MANCEMCGKRPESSIVEIEGTRMNVCNTCAGFGKIVKKIQPKISKPMINTDIGSGNEPSENVPEPEIIESVIDGYPGVIRRIREKKGMTQKEFAKLINEKVSVLQHIEKGRLEPSLMLARKLERMLNITLIEEVEYNPRILQEKKDHDKDRNAFTLGDFIKRRK